MLKHAYVLAAALLLVASGCGGITVNSRVAPNTDLAQFRTFGWYQAPGQPEQPQTLAEQQLRSAVRQSLAAKGITQARPGEQPDFLVAYHVVTQQRAEAEPGYYGWWGPGAGVYTYTEGTIVLDFINPRTNTTFWRGTASGVVENINNPNPKKIDAAVSKMVKQYPYNVAVTPAPPKM